MLLCYYQKLGFNNTLVQKLENCEKLSTEFSFCIWLARNNAVCQSVELNSPIVNTTPLESRSPLIPKAKIKSNLSNSLTLSKSPVVSINKGNTCHGNSILQAVTVVLLPWRTSKGSAQTSQLLKSVTVNMAIKENQLCQLILQIFWLH